MIPEMRQISSRSLPGLEETTLRDFSGGLNVVDNQLNLSSRFSPEMVNMVLGADGSLTTKGGSRFFVDVFSTLQGDIVDGFYYNTRIILVGRNGHVVTVDGLGNVTAIWNNEIAQELDGTGGWDDTDFISYAPFNGQVVICNGKNKPIVIDQSLICRYLVDAVSLSNANVPICRYVRTVDQYLVLAGDPFSEDKVYVGGTGTLGTFFGEASTDAVNLLLGGYISEGSPKIKGIGIFKKQAIFGFEAGLLVMTFGGFNDAGEHVPVVSDFIPTQGCISHRAMESVGDNLYITDVAGVHSVKRAVLSATEVEDNREGQLVDPLIQRYLNRLNNDTLENRVFSVYDRLNFTYKLFIPTSNSVEENPEVIVFNYKKQKQLRISGWSLERYEKWTAAIRTLEGRIFAVNKTKLYLLSSPDESITRRYINEQETWDDGTQFDDGYGFDDVNKDSPETNGLPIYFHWELPWGDFGARRKIKQTEYLGLDTEGFGQFKAEWFVDGIYEDASDTGEFWDDVTRFDDGYGFDRDLPLLDPALTEEFTGGSTKGFGLSPFGSNFGGSRVGGGAALYVWPSSFTLGKLRFSGYADSTLSFASLSLLYKYGANRLG